MYINNNLRNEVFQSSILHGFWDNNRTYLEFIDNVLGEFEEVLEELKNHNPKEVYYKDENKFCGAPTELADIIIFILDYFGGSNPPIDIDEEFLLEKNKYYKNEQWYKECANKSPYKYFLEIRDEAKKHLLLSIHDKTNYDNLEFIGDDGIKHSVPKELHEVIKLILEFCDIYDIDIEKVLIKKINYNKSRPKDYRKIGSSDMLETDYDVIMSRALNMGHGAYKLVDDVIDSNKSINNEIMRKREMRSELENEQSSNGKKL